jgi:hypothetical protein
MLEGPQYNPWYQESQMNEEKVNRAKKEKIDFHLPERFPPGLSKIRRVAGIGEIAIFIL